MPQHSEGRSLSVRTAASRGWSSRRSPEQISRPEATTRSTPSSPASTAAGGNRTAHLRGTADALDTELRPRPRRRRRPNGRRRGPRGRAVDVTGRPLATGDSRKTPGGGAVLSALAVAVAGGLELAIGEPPTRLHPVAWFGRLVGAVDREWDHPLAVGGFAAALSPVGVAVVVGGSVALAATREPLAAVALAGLALFLTTSLRSLLSTARGVIADTDAALPAARDGLLALAGRDAARSQRARFAAPPSRAHLRTSPTASSRRWPRSSWAGSLLRASACQRFPSLPVQRRGSRLSTRWIRCSATARNASGHRGAARRRRDVAPGSAERAPACPRLWVAAVRTRARAWLDGVPSPNSGWPMGTAAAALDVGWRSRACTS